MAKTLEYNATLVRRVDLTPLLGIFHVRADEPPPPPRDADQVGWFVPGQYMTLGFNREASDEEGDDRPPSVRRPMSLASAPEEDGLEFYIRYVQKPESNLPLTHLLWRREAGARMYVRPVATGHFTIEHTVGADDTRLKVLVAAGTGLAPFVSMARSRILRDPNARLDDLAILHGASYPADLGYRDELSGLVAERGLKYVPTISRPKEAPDWSGTTGRVEALFSAERLEQTESSIGVEGGALRPDRAVVYVCGLQGTIEQSVTGLIPRGFVPNNRKIRKALEVPEEIPSSLFYEQYDTTPVIDVKDEPLVSRLRSQLHAALGL